MRAAIILFLLGVLALQWSPTLPERAALLAITILCAAAAAGCVFLFRGWRTGLALVAAFAAGFSWAGWRAEWRLADSLPMTAEARDVVVTGAIHGLPQRLDGDAWRFVMAVESADAQVPGRIQLGWYAFRGRGEVPEVLQPGERYQLVVRVKRPHGFSNPGGFDYEAWLLERGIRATGYVREDARNRRLDGSVPGFMNAVHRVRDDLRRRFEATLADQPHTGILTALAIGDQRAITQQQWEVFRRTAVGHLVAISGLHVSLVALAVGGLAGWGWRRLPRLVVRVPARRVAALSGLAAATAYALLAGLGLPTQRALVMLAVAALAIAHGRQSEPTRVLALALLCVLLVDPWAVLSPGFWLSFGAVAVILLVACGRLVAEGALRGAVRIQLAITLVLAPVLFLLFGAFSLAGPFANAFAIPLVSFVIAPLVLLAIVLPWPWLLEAAHAVTGLMMVALTRLAEQPWALWHGPRVPLLLLLCALAGAAWMLMPRGTPARAAGALAIVPLLLWSPPRPASEAFRATVLDVGQGLAVHVQTARHDVLYDTGPGYGPEADAGGRVLVPYLRAHGVMRLDAVVLSHGDSDHVGGARSVSAALPVGRWWSGGGVDPARLGPPEAEPVPCRAGDSWIFDDVRFEFIHPADGAAASRQRNERSCVLRVRSPYGSLLLPGDIGAPSERMLAARTPQLLQADVIVAPHHGSRGSSTPLLVDAVAAAHVIHSVGNLNTHRHPHPDVWSRWDVAGARNWRTDGQGAVTVSFDAQGVQVEAWRERAPRYWHGR
ncbi:MAG: DNA internalization-related competence protein ComEC/Rec2 [Zoogloeaceae bacterium]|nr:DNA internalization-related competence protein ComEC/Rec2 [Zoogloeaceae bacterium]